MQQPLNFYESVLFEVGAVKSDLFRIYCHRIDQSDLPDGFDEFFFDLVEIG